MTAAATASPRRLLRGGVLLLSVVILSSRPVESFSANSNTNTVVASVTTPPPVPSKIDPTQNPQWLDVLKYDSEPTFDVLQKTIDFASGKTYESREPYFDEDYVFRGPIIGPITQQEVKRTQKGFQITDAYPDLETRPFGFSIDPDNPYRCYYMERWEGTNTGELQVGPITMPPTNNQVQIPTHVMSINWTPQGKIIYAGLSSPLDRWEGTTKGAGAVFGLLFGCGLNAGENAFIGNPFFRFQQRFFHALGGFGRNWSVEEEIPSWWESKARGADPNDL